MIFLASVQIRMEGLRLFLVWFMTLQENSTEEAYLIYATVIHGFPTPPAIQGSPLESIMTHTTRPVVNTDCKYTNSSALDSFVESTSESSLDNFFHPSPSPPPPPMKKCIIHITQAPRATQVSVWWIDGCVLQCVPVGPSVGTLHVVV